MKNPGRNQILVFLGIALTAFITLIVQEPLRIWINSYLFAKSVSYVVTSFHVEVNRNELLDLAKTEGIDFNFSLDDPFLRQYSLVTAKLTNEGPAIVDPVRFLVSTGNSRTKLLDIRYRVDSPDNKIVPMEHTVLPLTWDMDVARESKASLNLIADYPDQVEGLILYGSSTSETVGYGRINERLISGLTVTLPHRQEIYSPFFYAVSALTCGGESPLSTEGLQYPALLALQPFFKDVVWIDSSAPSTNSPDGSLNAPFRSFSEAKSTEAKTFIIKQRSQVVNEQADDLNGVQLLSMDDH